MQANKMSSPNRRRRLLLRLPLREETMPAGRLPAVRASYPVPSAFLQQVRELSLIARFANENDALLQEIHALRRDRDREPTPKPQASRPHPARSAPVNRPSTAPN